MGKMINITTSNADNNYNMTESQRTLHLLLGLYTLRKLQGTCEACEIQGKSNNLYMLNYKIQKHFL